MQLQFLVVTFLACLAFAAPVPDAEAVAEPGQSLQNVE